MLTHTRTLSVAQKAGWGLADMGIVVFVIVKQLLVLSFLTNYLNVPVGIAGLLTTSVLIFDIITDPIVGYLSDRTHSRWGRRVPWMVIGALILSGGIIGLFGVPQSLSLSGTIIWVGGFFALATVGFTMVAIPYGATAGEMTQDPENGFIGAIPEDQPDLVGGTGHTVGQDRFHTALQVENRRRCFFACLNARLVVSIDVDEFAV